MLHTKPQGHWPFGSGEEGFFEGFFFFFLPYMGVAAILVMWPRPANKLSFPYPVEAPYEIWLWLAQGFGEDLWKWRTDDGRRIPEDGRTTEHAYTISSPMLRWAKKVSSCAHFFRVSWKKRSRKFFFFFFFFFCIGDFSFKHVGPAFERQ